MAQLLVEADKAMTSSFIYTEIIIAFVLVVGVVITIGALMLKHCVKNKGTIKQHYSVFCIILVLASQLISWGFCLNFRNRTNAMTHISDIKYAKSDSFLMNTSLLKSSSYQKFGTYGYFSNLIANAIRNDGSSVERITLKYFNDGEIYGSLNNKSDVFGIDESNNVIVIMMESVEWFGLGDGKYDPTFRNLIYDDPQIGGGTLTPNITKLIYGEDYLSATQQESLVVKNFFAKSKTNNNLYYIIDHKTNEKIEQDNKYNKYCLEPITHIADISYMHYALQLNLYEYLLKREGYVPKSAEFKLILNHVTPEFSKLIQLPNLQTEIRDMIIEYILNNK
jgi:hypothetical protein